MSNTTVFYFFGECLTTPSTQYSTIAFVLVNVPLVLPLCLYILRLGVQRWRSGANISHTDFFTYNVVVIQLLTIIGSCLLTISIFSLSYLLLLIGYFMLLFSYSAVMNFQILTCLERYVAVVHPITYLSLKSQTGTLIRNISCGFVWLECIIQTGVTAVAKYSTGYFYFFVINLSFSFLTVVLCNVCVLCVLIHPRPGDGAKGNQNKQRALYMITVIMAMLLLKFAGDSLSLFSLFSGVYTLNESCLMYFLVNWFTLPSTLVLPLLFLQRNRKLLCFKTNK